MPKSAGWRIAGDREVVFTRCKGALQHRQWATVQDTVVKRFTTYFTMIGKPKQDIQIYVALQPWQLVT
jgi:hypothetical protein